MGRGRGLASPAQPATIVISTYVHYTTSGEFTASSAYKVAKEMEQKDKNSQLPTTSRASTNCSWKRLWSLQTISKVKMARWQWLSRCLPTKIALLHRNVIKNSRDAFCPLYCKEIEIDIHLFINCSKTKKVWEKGSKGSFHEWRNFHMFPTTQAV